MKFIIAQSPIDAESMRRQVLNHACGACVIFEGWIRDQSEGRAVLRLEYEIYHPLAISEGERVLEEAMQKFDVESVACTHREGMLQLGETAVIALAVARHRDEAFRACRYIIDEIKQRLPIWKKEYYTDGDAQWVNCQRCADHGAEAAGHQLEADGE
jgi:molybdopterin synthase catalytic subunit